MSKSFMDLIIMKINKDIDDYSAVQYSKLENAQQIVKFTKNLTI